MTILEDVQRHLAGRYEIERELGRGGMGAVYLARDVKLGRSVALKVLPAEFATETALRERFLRETRMAASFSHPNIVPVYSVEEGDDLLAYVMGYVEGESLAERVRRAGPLSVRETVKLLQDVAYALAYAHGRGIVHRDIKPDNVMIERATGRALVMDFGVSRVISAPGPTVQEGLTRIGEVVGTAEYMSPEQATGDHVDGRSDLYSLGLTAYYAVTGSVAMAADSTGKALVKQITETLPPMATVRPDLPRALAESIDRCLLKDPDARFPDAERLVEALDAAQLTAPEIPVPIRLFAQELGSTSLVLIGSGALAYFVIKSSSDSGSVDALLPAVTLIGMVVARVLQSFAEARRLAIGGFSADSVNRGLRAVVDERRARREELRANDVTRRVRRRTMGLSVAGLVGSFVLLRVALVFRVQVGPRTYHTSLFGITLVFVAVIMFGASVPLLIRSPFRMPLGERLFRFIWLGPLGRGLVRVAGRRLARSSTGTTLGGIHTPRRAELTAVPEAISPPQVLAGSKPVSLPPGEIEALELRVAELERWRREG